MEGTGTGGGWIRRELDWEFEPAEVLRLLRDDPYQVALIGDWAGGGAVIASRPRLVRAPPAPLAEVFGQPFPVGPGGPASSLGDPPAVDGGFGGGWIGYLGYGAAREWLAVPPAPGEPARLPEWWFGFFDHVLRLDAGSGRWFFEALVTPGEEESRPGHLFRELTEKSQADSGKSRDYRCDEFGILPSGPEHREAVRQAVGLIRDGDIFQANICLRLEAGFGGNPLDLFCAGVSALRPPFAAFLRIDGGAVASLSPELFLRRSGRDVLTQPIKGIIRRSAGARRAEEQRRELAGSAKNQAENVMIVDLMRNDLARVCEAGSVAVPRLLHAQPHPGVWHLVSDVTGTLEPGCGDDELVRATFPPGSITGAPKVRSMEVIAELEAARREVYTGAIGYRSPVAGLELNVAIRTFEFAGDRVWLGAGGGIVADSRPGEEFSECLIKAGPLIRAIGGRVAPAGWPAGGAGGAGPDGGIALWPVTVPGGLGGHKWADRRLIGALCEALPDPGGQPLIQDVTGEILETDRANVFAVVGGVLRTPAADGRLLPGIARGAMVRAAEGAGMIVKAGPLRVEDLAGASEVFVTNSVRGVLPVTSVAGRPVAGYDGPVTRAARDWLAARPASEAVYAPGLAGGGLAGGGLAGGGLAGGGRRRAGRRAGRGRAGGAGRGPGGPLVVLIDNYDSFTYNLAHLLIGTGCRIEVVRNDEVTAADMAGRAAGGDAGRWWHGAVLYQVGWPPGRAWS